MTIPDGQQCQGRPRVADRWYRPPDGQEKPADGTVIAVHNGWQSCTKRATREYDGFYFCGTHGNVVERERERIATSARNDRRARLKVEADLRKTACETAAWSLLGRLASADGMDSVFDWRAEALEVLAMRDAWLAAVKDVNNA